MIRAEKQLMPLIRIAGLFALLLAAGCAAMSRAPEGDPPRTGAAQETVPAPEPQQAAAKQEEAVAARPAQAAPKADKPVAVEPVPPAAAPPIFVSANPGAAKSAAPVAVEPVPPPAPITASANPGAAKADAPAAKPAAKAPAPAAPRTESAAPPAPKPPPLDLKSLEKRLKDTDAIGVFTKLTLKNQVDALLEKFRAYYQGRIKTTLDQLRQPYDQLLMKVLSLLQDSDPPLARDIVQSREAIWAILSDPKKFNDL